MNKHFFTILLTITSLSCQAMELTTTSQNNSYFTDMATAPEKCIALLKQLDAQPIFNGKHQIHHGYIENIKILPLHNRYDCRIVDMLCDAARRENPQKSGGWLVSFFDGIKGPSCIYNTDGTLLKEIGIWKELYCEPENSLEELKTVFDSLINKATTNWKSSTIEDNSKILRKKNEDWSLFIKPQTFIDEDTFIRAFAFANFLYGGSNDTIDCPGPTDTGLLYLWIKKEALRQVIQTLNLKIS